tara:strand:+ start:1934 stop:2113 length:180 start_codon:yes stop_codon:yes gene_type:complete
MKGVKHYKKDGTAFNGNSHKMEDGTLHSGKTHSATSVRLFHFGKLTKTAQATAKNSWGK